MAARRGKRIAIVGTAPSYRETPFDDDSWEIWSCNKPGLNLERWDKIFEIHQRWDDDHLDYLDDLRRVKPPQEVVSVVFIGGTANKVIDRERLFRKYGTVWLSSSIAYMLACALDEEPEEIGIWGVEMEAREEYVVQFAGCRHFIDLARALGIKVTTPKGCLLLRDPVPYPDRFETVMALTYENKAQLAEKLLRRWRRKFESAVFRSGYIQGRYLRDGLVDLDDVPDHQKEDLDEAQDYLSYCRETVARLEGELWATQLYKRLFVWNVLPPDFGEATTEDARNPGPV